MKKFGDLIEKFSKNPNPQTIILALDSIDGIT